ncbi:Arginine--tRNA ligase [Gossypium arboreum]|uniref:Arginine--tRNA ligase n=1 Tax=Gossypium arboreum TaxID=29729 RepID=A0A0B0PJB1_GOSAR|nr:Arginine--tRNA ligase [Gossypium arboreum]
MRYCAGFTEQSKRMNITHDKVPPSSAFVCKGKPPNLVDS